MIFYAYFGYPLCLLIISVFKQSIHRNGYELKPKSYQLPAVTFIITAHNEEKLIRKKIENTLAQDYPSGRLEIIIASDCSTDGTDKIVQSFKDQGVQLIRAPERKGKEHAQKLAVDASTGDILVFSDVATILKPDGISNIVKNFTDPSIGCVSSEDKFIDSDGNLSGEGAYVRYEMLLRKLESKVNSLVGLSGSFFAARREVCQKWSTNLQSDFNTLLNSMKLGLRGISDPNTVGYYEDISDEKKEFNRKTRTVLRGITVFMSSLPLLNPFKYGLFSWQLFSHKLCRWLVPFFLILAFISNAMMMPSSAFFTLLFILQITFYVLAFIYFQIETRNPHNYQLRAMSYQLLKLPYYFVLVNASILVAWLKYVKGERASFWEPSKR
jgi:cellulose synthase/poly-beta-1,6-N-acetylglucosamine synthase-like glycosyltransferase